MNDIPRQTLNQIVQQYGAEACKDARRCEGLLRDLCGDHRREIFVLISALEENIVETLRALTGQLPFSVVLPRLAAELRETTALSDDAARWAVAVWAEALGIASSDEVDQALRPGKGSAPLMAPLPTVATATTPREYKLTHQWTAHEGEIGSVAFGPDGRQIVSVGMDARAKIWSVADAREAAALTQQTGILTAAAWHPDGLSLALGSGDMGIYLWRWTDRGGDVPRMRGHQGAVTGVTFLAGGTLASCSQDGTLRLWDSDAGTLAATVRGHTGAVLDLAASLDGRTLASAGGWDRTVRVWDVAQRQELWSLTGHTAQVTAVTFDSHGQMVASGGWDEKVRLWNVARGLPISTMGGEPAGASNPDQEREVRLLTSVAFAPDGGLLAAGDWQGGVQLWDIFSQTRLALLNAHEARIRRVAFSPGGRWLASADDAGMICLWRGTNVPSGQANTTP